MEEVQAFLFESRCDFLYLDMFCLDPFVLVKRALLPSSMASRPYLVLRDISGGKEVVPVPCVNELNTVSPPPLTYTRHRVPAPGVFINTNLDFMVGCDCTDGCRDRCVCGGGGIFYILMVPTRAGISELFASFLSTSKTAGIFKP